MDRIKQKMKKVKKKVKEEASNHQMERGFVLFPNVKQVWTQKKKVGIDGS